MEQRAACVSGGSAARFRRVAGITLALLTLAACSAPAALTPPPTDPFYVAPAMPRDGAAPPTVRAGPRGGGGAHGGGAYGSGMGGSNAGSQYPAIQSPGEGFPAASGSMQMGGGGGL